MEDLSKILDTYKIHTEFYDKKRIAVERAQARFEKAGAKLGINTNIATPLAILIKDRLQGDSYDAMGPFGLSNECGISVKKEGSKDSIFYVSLQIGVGEDGESVLLFLKGYDTQWNNREKLVDATDWDIDKIIAFSDNDCKI